MRKLMAQINSSKLIMSDSSEVVIVKKQKHLVRTSLRPSLHREPVNQDEIREVCSEFTWELVELKIYFLSELT